MNKLSKSQKVVYDMEKYAGGSIAVICGSLLIEGTRSQAELTAAINGLYRLNPALRTRITETDEGVVQSVLEYTEQDINILRFNNKDELERYAEDYAKKTLDLYGALCELRGILLPGRCGALIKLHHIVGDAWSLALLCSHLIALLNGEVPQAFPYAEHLENEAAYLQSDHYVKDRTFFLEQFKKCDEVTYLSEKQSNSFISARKTFIIDADKTSRIVGYTKQKSISPFILFMTSVATYISRTKQNVEKFYIGTAVLNRNGAREKNMVGLFVDTVPVLIELDNRKAFSENLMAVKKSMFSILRHQKFNYGEVLSAIRQEYGFTEKLYDVMLSYQNAAIVGGKAESAWYHNGAQTEALQIHIDDRDNEGIFRIHFDYQTDKFTEYEIERMYGHVINLLFDAIEEDSKPLYELEILSAGEKQKLLYEFNDTAADYPRDKCVHQLFEEQVKKTPEKTALIACDRTLTYGELNEQANRIANALIDQCVKPGDIVAFVLPRRSYLIAAMFGILKVGATYLPIDPDHPQDRINYMVEDSGAAFFIPEDNITTLLAHGNNCDPNVEITANALCYCIYTSGSTGRPKGTVITHRNVVNYTHNNSDNVVHKIIKSSYRTIVSVTTVGFDIFVTESILPLLNGLEIILADERQATIQSELNSLLAQKKADVLQTTPTKMRSLMGDAAECAYLNSLKAIILGGEAVDSSLICAMKQLTSVRIFNIYGPTETTVWSTNTEIFSDTDITIGKPIANTQIYLLDRYMQPVPIGVTGELCITGDGVGAGYLNRPELTAEKFIDNPFGNGKLYKTGDLAYWREDGNIVYVGRNDFQVKIRGLRIELGEIENALQGVQGVLQAVVTVRKTEDGRQIICAFYTGQETDGKILRAAIGQRLPKYMLPHSFTHLAELPLTSSGKVNRKALPEVDLSNIANTVEYIAPKTETETAVINAVQSVLHTIKVGTADNFFDLGGDSLKAIELIAVLEQSGYSTEVKTVFEADTLEELAKRLTGPKTDRQIEIPNGPIPASNAQMRVYTAQAMAGGTAYNIPYVFRVKSLDPVKLQAAVSQLVARHESLRTRFENWDGRIMQIVEKTANCPLEVLSSEDISAFVRAFDLATAPLLRVGYYKNTVMIDMHHIITDGSSMPIFLRELNELYMNRTLSKNPVQYREFAIQNQSDTQSEQYWLSVYSDEPPVLEMNTDYPRQGKQTFSGVALYEEFPHTLHEQICTECRAQNITPYAFYMGAFYVLLSKFSGNEDIVVGVPVSGRSSKFLDSIGMFVNTLALRNRPEGSKTVSEFLQEIRNTTVLAMEYQEYPYGDLVKKLGVHAENRNPLFDVIFAYQSDEMTNVVFEDEPVELLPVPITVAKCDFTFNIYPRSDNIIIMVEYCIDLYKEQTIRRLLEGYRLILTQMLNSKTQLGNISTITDVELKLLLHDFNDTEVDYSREKCVHTLLEEHAEKVADINAVIACDRNLTYQELNEQANQIAHSLIDLGVQPGDIVAYALPRKSYLIAAMFGILKSGAAYLPIDPDYPQDRIDYMLSDSRASYFITEINIHQLLKNENRSNPNIPLSSDSLCYCIYTSGSTGEPKGTLILHRNVINYVNCNRHNVVHSVIMDSCKTIVSVATPCFDMFTTEGLLSISNGMTILLANEEQAKMQPALNQFLKENPADVLQTTPTKMKILLDDPLQCEYLKHLKVILLGGEIVDNILISNLKEYTDARIFDMYGPTETTVWSTKAEIVSINDIIIGKPIANTQIYIVDRYMQPAPIGVTGELCVAGDGVGAGYLNRPELTAEKFIDNPFGNGKLYKTGDLAYWREDGNIVYVGRNDFQVKIRGLRIELGEIENALQGVEGISQAAVTVCKDEGGRQLICAFYTGQEMDRKALRSAMGQSLPKYMLPHSFMRLDEMPLTSSGKVNRKALPKVDLSQISTAAEYIEPVGETEKQLAALMEQILGYSPIGREDDFFDLGGDSLKAIEFVSKAHSEGTYFALQSIFDYPTVRQLTEYIQAGDKQTVFYSDADFTEINKILEKNKLEYISAPQKTEVGNILLAGATGYLGIHILADFIEHENGVAFCLVRGKNQADSEKRLINLLNFYFGEQYSKCDRIRVLCADLQKEHLGLTEQVYEAIIPEITTVINAAASVKHYGSYQYFYEANVETVKRLIEFCGIAKAKLIHTSTLSVSGNGFLDEFSGYISETEKHFFESSLYIGQPLDNVYARSKFEAEKVVLEAMGKGLKANILRMGNLSNRLSDGVFQKNYNTNAVLKRIKALLELGMIPDYLMNIDAEFTPIDEAARAVMIITQHFNTEQTVFHINSTKVVYLDKLHGYFSELGYPIESVDGVKFTDILRKTMEQSDMKHIFETFIGDLDANDRLNYDSNIHIRNDFTSHYLQRLGFEWSNIGLEYFRKYVLYFKKIGYLEDTVGK